jgi:hypothetical protein
VIVKTVLKEKWLKGKAIIQGVETLVRNHPINHPSLKQKDLEQRTGFLNHLAMTFEDMSPFLKGFYLTFSSWRGKRDVVDWKMSNEVWMKCLVAQMENGNISEAEFDPLELRGCPVEVTASSRFGDNVRALAIMFVPDEVLEVNLRSKKIFTAMYGFGDASGLCLGATFTFGTGFTFRVGVWGPDESDQSSSWTAFTNIVDSLEDKGSNGNLLNSFADHLTVESCSIKCLSSSP